MGLVAVRRASTGGIGLGASRVVVSSAAEPVALDDRRPVSGRRSASSLLSQARRSIHRVEPHELSDTLRRGALIIDIRPVAQRAEEGELGFGVIVERNVLEWRLDPGEPHALPEVEGYDREVIVVCSEGYASSLAAASLRQMGFTRAGDLAGGFRAWSAYQASLTVPATTADALG